MSCPECRADYSSNPKCGLRLFHSENECAICMEECSEMIALPCGHQFCREDLKMLGLYESDPDDKKRKSDGDDGPSTWRRRIAAPRRCSWCGHLGHTIRRCVEHQEQCPCQEGSPSGEHFTILRAKLRCEDCGKRGHDQGGCDTIVLY